MTSDSGYGNATLFRHGLTERGLRYVVQVDTTCGARKSRSGYAAREGTESKMNLNGWGRG
ncbi:transposase [Dactylosporangium sp. McL0621]|uniref:transposase n=1 Tax=Dactylosporangium sp. McL0621 TaxID=3415678 RepID=UPI003CEB1994